MAHIQHKAGTSLRIALLLSAFFIAQTHASTQTKTASIHSDTSFIQQKQQEALSQIDLIESIFDTIGQTLASGASNIPAQLKAQTRIKLNLLRREDIDKVKNYSSMNVTTPEQLYQLALFNSEVIAILEQAVATDLKIIPSFDFVGIQKRYLEATQDITPEKISAVLKENSIRLIKLDKASQKIGLSAINGIYRGIRKFNKDWSVTYWAEHAAVYSAFVIWYTYVTSEGKGAKLPYPLSSLFGWVKPWTAGMPSKNTMSVEKNATFYETVRKEGETDSITPAGPSIFKVINGPKGNLQEINGFKDFDVTKVVKDEKGNPLAPDEYKVTIASEVTNTESSLINNMQGVLGPIVKFTHEPMATIAVGALFLNYFKNDAVKVYDKLNTYKNRLDDHFFGTAKKNSHDEVGTRTERFKDIVGREEVKTELSRVVEYICNPDRFDRAGIKVERGYLLAGEPQTGKTLMARALAGEISAELEKQGKNQKMRLFEISTEDLARKGIGHYMHIAKSLSPCILFLDELDLLRLQRDGDSKTLSEFLTSMSGSLNNNEKDQVIILAATNKPENLDFALRQHGRFGKMFWFDKPTFKHRVEFFIKECEKRCMNPDNFNFISLAQQTEGCSFGSLDLVFKKSLMHAKIENAPVSQTHFERAIDFEIRKLIPNGYSIAPDKEVVIAARQAGKALVSMLLAPAKTLCSVTILPITQELEEEHVSQQYNFGDIKRKEQRAVRYGSIFAYHLYDSLDIQTQEEMVKQCKILLASNAAQKVHGLSSCAFDKFDKQAAFALAKTIIFEGLDPKELAKEIRNQKLTQAYRLIEQYEAEVETVLAKHKQDLALIIEALQKHKTLSVGQINELLAPLKK